MTPSSARVERRFNRGPPARAGTGNQPRRIRENVLMRPPDALAIFRRHLQSGCLTAGDPGARSAITAMPGFYAAERAAGHRPGR